MHFGKKHILLVVLLFSLEHVRSDENYDAAINDEADVGVADQANLGDDGQADEGVDDLADEGVDDQADEGVDDQADEGVDDQADEGVDDQADEGVEDLADDAGVNDDAAIADEAGDNTSALNANNAVADEDSAVADDDKHIVEANGGNAPETGMMVDKSGPCQVGTYFSVDCNVCFCYESNVQGCTTTDCSKQSKKTLLSNPATRLTFKKLRDSATGCVPGEKIKQGKCECSCALPSVLTCPKNCL